MKTLILKFLILFVPLGLFVWSVKSYVRSKEINGKLSIRMLPQVTNCYFLGTSRVSNSIDPKLIESHCPELHVENLGIPRGTFLSSAILTEHLIRKDNGESIILFELSPIESSLPDELYCLAPTAYHRASFNIYNMLKGGSPRAAFNKAIQVGNNYLYSMISLRSEVNKILLNQMTADWTSTVGFTPRSDCTYEGSVIFFD